MEHWLKEAAEFVMRNRWFLTSRPVSLLSSGPLATETKDPQERDLRVLSEPKEIAKFRQAINPPDHRVFFGGLHSSKLIPQHRIIPKMPAGLALLREGDFRDWNNVEA